MDDNISSKLNNILDKHKNKIVSIRNFDQLFDELKLRVDSIVQNINKVLSESTGDNLELYFSDPFSINRSNYVMVLKFLDKNEYGMFTLINKQNETSHIFILGLENGGTINITMKLSSVSDRNKFITTESIEWSGPIVDISNDTIENIIIGFIDNVYSN